ncbi:MAG: hypothetical protein JSW28_08910 [Thermoplasmata archaeon]|nr:MAG: hypothetical protein JSW28_08910 [Thermoplasmata archaeon]
MVLEGDEAISELMYKLGTEISSLLREANEIHLINEELIQKNYSKMFVFYPYILDDINFSIMGDWDINLTINMAKIHINSSMLISEHRTALLFADQIEHHNYPTDITPDADMGIIRENLKKSFDFIKDELELATLKSFEAPYKLMDMSDSIINNLSNCRKGKKQCKYWLFGNEDKEKEYPISNCSIDVLKKNAEEFADIFISVYFPSIVPNNYIANIHNGDTPLCTATELRDALGHIIKGCTEQSEKSVRDEFLLAKEHIRRGCVEAVQGYVQQRVKELNKIALAYNSIFQDKSHKVHNLPEYRKSIENIKNNICVARMKKATKTWMESLGLFGQSLKLLNESERTFAEKVVDKDYCR